MRRPRPNLIGPSARRRLLNRSRRLTRGRLAHRQPERSCCRPRSIQKIHCPSHPPGRLHRPRHSKDCRLPRLRRLTGRRPTAPHSIDSCCRQHRRRLHRPTLRMLLRWYRWHPHCRRCCPRTRWLLRTAIRTRRSSPGKCFRSGWVPHRPTSRCWNQGCWRPADLRPIRRRHHCWHWAIPCWASGCPPQTRHRCSRSADLAWAAGCPMRRLVRRSACRRYHRRRRPCPGRPFHRPGYRPVRPHFHRLHRHLTNLADRRMHLHCQPVRQRPRQRPSRATRPRAFPSHRRHRHSVNRPGNCHPESYCPGNCHSMHRR